MTGPASLVWAAEALLEAAARAGATAAEAYAVGRRQLEVRVRVEEVERVSCSESAGIGLRLFAGAREGFGHTNDLSPGSLAELARRTFLLARHAPETGEEGVALPRPIPGDLDLLDREALAIDAARAVEYALAAERAALGAGPGIVASEGSVFEVELRTDVLRSSRGAAGDWSGSSVSLRSCPVAGSEGRFESGWYSVGARFLSELPAPESVGREAARRALLLAGGRRVPTARVPVVLAPEAAISFLYGISGAFHGDRAARGTTFLASSRGERIASEAVTLVDDGRLPRRLGSIPFDGEGTPTSRKILVDRGVLSSFLHDRASARRAAGEPTGNALRPGYESPPAIATTNLELPAGRDDPAGIVAAVASGLYVMTLQGFGFDLAAGDFSQSVRGLWIEKGELAFPVRDATVSGRIRDVLGAIDAVGTDLVVEGAFASPTIRVAELTVGGEARGD